MTETVTLPFPSLMKKAAGLKRGEDGEGSLQVQLDPGVKIGTAKVFAIYG